MSPPLASFWTRLTALPSLYLGLWAALGVLTVALIVLMRTPWGRERPTHRYVLLSLVAHLALICLATTVRFMSAPRGEASTSPIKVRIVMQTPTSEPTEVETPTPIAVTPETPVPDLVEPDLPKPNDSADPAPSENQPEPPTAPPLLPAPEPTPTAVSEQPAPASKVANPTEAAATPQAAAESIAAAEPSATPPRQQPFETSTPAQARLPVITASSAPPAYAARQQDDRLKVVEQEGGSRATEDAVAAGLAWLALAQSPEGRWDADRWAAGRETQTLGHNRRGAGAKADTGITGLALLALMGAGNTHEEGAYAANVRDGLNFLLTSQASDGGLAGDAAVFAQTYCHSMATFALAEALATTDDRRLERGVRRAVDFLVARQDRAGGGWRYQPGTEGDLSQLGWIVMALRSAELGGIDAPPTVWSSIERFLRSTRRGRSGGMACYQPRGPISRTMTAESLYCQQILGWPTAGTPAATEAVDHLLGAVPGNGKPNLYYWYYAALALHHHRDADASAGRAWRHWNAAMSQTLTINQLKDGPNAGSWSPNTMWGGYGGRVYSTAMATMCLEVYYRYDPDEVSRDPWIAARPSGLRR